MRALVIDDSATIRRIVRETLERRLGLGVVEAESVQQAQDRLSGQEPFDLVITDLLMPGGNGFSLIRWLREGEDRARVPVLVVSVEANSRALAEAAQAGASAFLVKPFSVDALVEKVRSVLPAQPQLP